MIELLLVMTDDEVASALASGKESAFDPSCMLKSP